MRAPRDRLLVQLLGGLALIAGCSRLTSVDWSRIPPSETSGGSAGATDSGGGAGEPAGGSSPSGSAGESGEAGSGEGGDAGSDSGGGSGSGTGGFGGFGGIGGTGGFSGSSGAGTGGASTGGMGGTGGGLSEEPDPCTGTPSTVVAADLVLFDGGQGQPNTARGGRAGLDAACTTALGKISLPQSKTHAFITVDAVTDSINRWPTSYPDISQTARVVGPTGIQLASNFADLIKGTIEQSLACAAVTSASDRTWLTGGSACSSIEPVGCFVAGDGRDNCSGWTIGNYDAEIQARYGYTIYKDARWAKGDTDTSPFAKIACNAATDNILCLAYTPL